MIEHDEAECARHGITAEMIEAAAIVLREAQLGRISAGPWDQVSKSVRSDWRLRAEVVLLAAFRARDRHEMPPSIQGKPGTWQDQHDREAGLAERTIPHWPV